MENNYYREKIKKILEKFEIWYNLLTEGSKTYLLKTNYDFYSNLNLILLIYKDNIDGCKAYKENINFANFINKLQNEFNKKEADRINENYKECEICWFEIGGIKTYDLIDSLLYYEISRVICDYACFEIFFEYKGDLWKEGETALNNLYNWEGLLK